jgi:hypothetical protein
MRCQEALLLFSFQIQEGLVLGSLFVGHIGYKAPLVRLPICLAKFPDSADLVMTYLMRSTLDMSKV